DAEALHPLEQIGRTVAVLQAQHALGRLVEAGQAIEHRGFAGTVGADDRGDLPVGGGKRDVVDGDQPAEPHAEMIDLEQRRGVGPAGPLRRPRPPWSRMVGWRVATSPAGRHSMIRIIARPNATMRNCAKSRKNSGKPISRNAANTTPSWLPKPPSTTIARITA